MTLNSGDRAASMHSSANRAGVDVVVLERGEHVGQAAVLGGVRVGPADDEDHVRPVEPGGPDLLPGDHQLVAVDDAAGGDAGQVGALARLGEALAVDVLAGDD